MKLYPRKNSRVMDPRNMRALEDDGTKVNPKDFETYWHRQNLAGDVFESSEARDKAAADIEAKVKEGAERLKKGREAVEAKKAKAKAEAKAEAEAEDSSEQEIKSDADVKAQEAAATAEAAAKAKAKAESKPETKTEKKSGGK